MSAKSIFKNVNGFFVTAGIAFIGLIVNLQSFSTNVGGMLAVIFNAIAIVCCIFLGIKVRSASKVNK